MENLPPPDAGVVQVTSRSAYRAQRGQPVSSWVNAFEEAVPASEKNWVRHHKAGGWLPSARTNARNRANSAICSSGILFNPVLPTLEPPMP